MRTPGEGGLEKIGTIWYVTYYNLQGKQVRRSSKSRLKSVAIEMLKKAKEELGRGGEPAFTRKLWYGDLRQVLLDDYRDKGRLVMDGDDPVITGRRGHLKALDDYFRGMPVAAIGGVLRKFVDERVAAGVAGPTINRSLAYLRRMFKLAQQQGKVSYVPYSPMQREFEPREGFVERPDFARFAEKCRNTCTLPSRSATKLDAVQERWRGLFGPGSTLRRARSTCLLVSSAGSNGRCNTIQCFDSRMLPRQHRSVWQYSMKT